MCRKKDEAAAQLTDEENAKKAAKRKLPLKLRELAKVSSENLDEYYGICKRDYSFGPYQGTDPVKDLEKVYRNEYMKKMSRRKFNQTDDPFLLYGFGAFSYFALISELAVAFFWVTVLTIPIVIVYTYLSNGLVDQAGAPQYALTSLGNFGQPGHFCAQSYLNYSSTVEIRCSVGHIRPALYAGLVPVTNTNELQEYSPDFCGDPSKFNLIRECTKRHVDSFTFR